MVFLNIKVLLFSGETAETPYAWFAWVVGYICVSNLAVRKLLDEFDPRSFWQVNSGSRKNRQNHQGRRLIACCFFLFFGSRSYMTEENY